MVKQTVYANECGCCGSYHPASFDGDCRDDAMRFPAQEMAELKELELRLLAEIGRCAAVTGIDTRVVEQGVAAAVAECANLAGLTK